jgi:ABC-2 type transport system permease protein
VRAILVIAAKDLRQRVRDRSVLLLAVVAPVVITVVMNLAFGSSGPSRFSLAVADADHGRLAQAFVAELSSPDLRGLISVRKAATPQALRRLVNSGDVDAGFVIPAGFSAAVETGQQATITVLDRTDLPISAGVAQSIASGFVARLNGIALAARSAIAGGQPQAALQMLVAQASSAPSAISTTEGAGGPPLKPSSYFAAGMGTFFVFFTVAFVGRGIVDERRQGTLTRLLAAPLRPSQILLGKVLSTFAIGCGALGIMWGVSTLAFNSPWGDPLAVVVLIIVEVLAAMGITALVMTLARTDDAAERWATIITMVLAILGGNFINLYSLPGPLMAISQATPNGQFLRAITDLVTTGGGLGTVLAPAGVIAAFAIVTGAIAAARSDRMVRV